MNSMQFRAIGLVAVLAAGVSSAPAQSAGEWMIKVGVNRIAPKVNSGDLSAPSLAGTQIDIKADTRLIISGAYMYTDHYSVEFIGGLPYKHEVNGAGAISGVGKIGTVNQVSPTVFGQYRFMDPDSRFRPYLGAGLTYAYFYHEEGTGALTGLTNAGGSPTRLSVDAGWGLSSQIGATWRLNKHWYLDAMAVKTWIKTTAHLSTGQSIDAKLDPVSVGISLAYRY